MEIHKLTKIRPSKLLIRMEAVLVDIYYTGNNFCAQAPILTGCVSTAANLADMKKNIKEAIGFHIESMLENDEPIPDVFKNDYRLKKS